MRFLQFEIEKKEKYRQQNYCVRVLTMNDTKQFTVSENAQLSRCRGPYTICTGGSVLGS